MHNFERLPREHNSILKKPAKEQNLNDFAAIRYIF